MVYQRPVAHGRILSVVPQNDLRLRSDNASNKTMSPDKDSRSHKDSIHPELLNKWETLFRYGDTDGDGFWTLKDLELIKQRLIKNAKMTPEQRDDVLKMAADAWKGFGNNRDETMSLGQYLFSMTSMYNSRSLEPFVKASRTRVFYCMDSDGDGLIDVNEFKLFSQAVGRIDDGTLEKAFKAIDVNGDKMISLTEYVGAHVRYCCDETVKYDDLPLFVKI